MNHIAAYAGSPPEVQADAGFGTNRDYNTITQDEAFNPRGGLDRLLEGHPICQVQPLVPSRACICCMSMRAYSLAHTPHSMLYIYPKAIHPI